MSNFWSESSSISILCVCKKQRLWLDCMYVQACLSLHCLSRMHVCAGSSEPSLLVDVMGTKISCADLYIVLYFSIIRIS